MKLLKTGVLIFVSVTLIACGGSDNDSSESDTVVQAQNLSTGTVTEPNFVYYDLDTESVVTLTEEEAETNQDWDIAFQRTKVYLNRFADTPVGLYFTENTDEFYDDTGAPVVDRFVNATAETELEAFTSMAITLPEDSEFQTDAGDPAIDDWYIYDFMTHTVTPDAETYFMVEADAGYAKFHVTNLVQSGFGMSSISLGVAYQSDSATEFASEQSVTVTSASCGDDVYVDLDTATEVSATDDWDITLPCSDALMDFEINIAADARAINDPTYSELDAVDPNAVSFYPWIDNVDVTFAITQHGDSRSRYGWGDYGVNGGHLFWPNFSVYVIKTASAYYKVQITSYYDTETSASGSYSFRFEEVEAESD